MPFQRQRPLLVLTEDNRAVLAYHAVQLIRTRLRGAGITLHWQSLRQRLRPWLRITTTLQTVNGEQIVTRQDGRPTVEQAEIVKAAGLQPGLYRVRTRRPV